MKVRTYKPGSGKKPEIELDDFDSWNCDHTLALIAVPLLKQLHANNHGFALVDDDDALECLSSKNAPPFEEWEWDDNAEERWNYVIGEIIWSLEYIVSDEFEPDMKKYMADEERCSEGCRLFGKYFRSLWD